MSSRVSKLCFPNPYDCHNCKRKTTIIYKKHTYSDHKQNSKRCGGCHLMTYCDADCQREHWLKVHKKHCKFLSGKTPVKNSQHDTATCPRCCQQRETSQTQGESENSPKTSCNIEKVHKCMLLRLSHLFGFHCEGKICNCSPDFDIGLKLPFPLGEVSGQYLEIASTGFDPMFAHALRILNAMTVKAINEERRNALFEVEVSIIDGRSLLWYDVLVSGKPTFRHSHHLLEQMMTVPMYGTNNPWWKLLRFSVQFIVRTNEVNAANFCDSNSLDDLRFLNVKIIHDYNLSELQKQALACEKKIWPKFMLWPQLVNGSLAVVLPPGTRCLSCNAELLGEVAIWPTISTQESYTDSTPMLSSHVGDNGALEVRCMLNPNCMLDYLNSRVETTIQSDEAQSKMFKEENKLFFIEARNCDFCLKMSLSSHRCSGCLTVQYCSLVCQKEDLEFHRTVCANWAKDKSRKIFGKGKQKLKHENYWLKCVAREK